MKRFLRSVFNRVNIRPIISEHVNSFYDNNILVNEHRKVIPFTDIVLFLGIPGLFSGILIGIFNISFDKDIINILITSLSIFIGLLLSLLVLLFDLGRKENEQLHALPSDPVAHIDKAKKKVALIREVFSQVIFSVVLSAGAILSTMSTQVIKFDSDIVLPESKIIDGITFAYFYASHFLSIFLICEFIITLLMILKRFKILFDLEFPSSTER
ncbi:MULTISPECIES: hypothetical protein [Sphingobacterium]|uniref:Uncharacterized protein n=1 Tax=Sphingobacterium populi TaxID=1812824 RepID=A0ABW5U8Z2_9SPHI|nr:hypothetical protein [Sphingobacterium sp. CFCC 11742]